jgi:hypothetical protein
VIQFAKRIKEDFTATLTPVHEELLFVFHEIVLNSDVVKFKSASGRKLKCVKITEKNKKKELKLRDFMDENQLSEFNFTMTYFVAVTEEIYQDCLAKLKRGKKAYTGKNDGTNSRVFLHDSESLITMTGRRIFSEMPQEELIIVAMIQREIGSKRKWLSRNGARFTERDAPYENKDWEFFSWKYDSEGVPTAQIYRHKVTGEKKPFKITQSEKPQESVKRESESGESRKSFQSEDEMTENNSEKDSKYSQESENGGIAVDESSEPSQSEEKITPQDDLKTKSSDIGASPEDSNESEPSRIGIANDLRFYFVLYSFYMYLLGLILVHYERKIQEKSLEIKKLKGEKAEADNFKIEIQTLTRSKKQLEEEKQKSARTIKDLQNQIRALKKKQIVENNKECQICNDDPRTHVLGCGHVYCEECSQKAVKKKKCFFCRKKVTSVLKMFL